MATPPNDIFGPNLIFRVFKKRYSALAEPANPNIIDPNVP